MKEIEELIGRLMAEHRVPAIQVGVIRGNEVEFFGAGMRDVENGLPADAHTSFAIGSQTKSFVSTALALLADEGKIRLDAPVRDYIPEFAMADASATETLSVRDILSHRSGLARHEFMLQLNIDNFSAADFIRRFRHLKMSAPIRSQMQYSNLMFMLAGYLVERVSGQTWSDFVGRRLLAPIGMNETNFSVAENSRIENRALPYRLRKGKIERMPCEDIKAAAPAGAMNSTVSDMLKYLRFHLDEGRAGEKAVVSAANIRECHTPQCIIAGSAPIFRGEMQFQAYGLGWFADCYRGRWIVRHGGGIDGFIAEMAMIPELDAGLVVCSNLHSNFVPAVLQLSILDALLGSERADWNARFNEMKTMGDALFAQQLESYGLNENKACPEPEAYAGAYEDFAYGRIDFCLEEGALVFKARKMRMPMRYLGYDNFLMLEENMRLAVPVQFARDARGRIVGVDVDFEPSIGAMIRYARKDAQSET